MEKFDQTTQINIQNNLGNCLGKNDFQLVDHDIAKPFNGLRKIDYLFHLIGLDDFVDQKSALDNMIKMTDGTSRLLELAKEREAKFLLATTFRSEFSLVTSRGLIKIMVDKKGPTASDLIRVKSFAETLTWQYFKNRQLDTRIVQLSFVYGPRMELKVNQPINQLFDRVVKKRPSAIAGGSVSKIYPTFVADAVYGLSKAMFGSGTNGQVFNLINLKPVTLSKFTQEVNRQSGLKIKIKSPTMSARLTFEKNQS